MPSKGAEAETRPFESELPYEPSVPCAQCARGVDPLRAACVTAHEHAVRYFCSRSCREAFRAAEAAHTERLASLAETQESGPERTLGRASLESVARRVEPPEPETPRWPLAAAGLLAALTFAPFPGAERVAALGIVGSAAALTIRTTLTRAESGLVGWLAAPLGVALLGLSALLRADRALLLAAALAILLLWRRERLVERANGVYAALREELTARLSPRVRVSLVQSGSSPRSERWLAELCTGDSVSVEASQAVPVDGTVVAGSARVLPYPDARDAISRRVGDSVLAGALVVSGAIEVRALRVGPRRTLFAALEPLQPGQPVLPAVRAAVVARRPATALLAVGALLALALLASGSFAQALSSFAAALLALPVLASARGAHTPLREARRQAAARGLCFRDVDALQRAGRIDTVAIRVEGALAARDYALSEVCSLSAAHDAGRLLSLAHSAEQVAAEGHAIARALKAYAERVGVEHVPLRRVVYMPGRGIAALADGHGALVLGSRQALLDAGVSVAVADRAAQRAEQQGQRVVFLSLDGHVRGLLMLEQTVRPEARVAVQTLFDLGLDVALLSGDHRTTLEAIARPLDVAHVKSELSAPERAAEVRRLREGDARVAAIGTLPHDEALLATADVALCLDAAALAGEQAITSAGYDLRDAAAALVIARQAQRNARRLWAAVAIGSALTGLAAAGLLHPALVAAGALGVDTLALARETAGRRAAAGANSK